MILHMLLFPGQVFGSCWPWVILIIHPSKAVALTSKQVAVGDLKTYNKLLESTADVAEYICRNSLVEGLVTGFSSTTADELRRALVKLYASILTYLAKAKVYYYQNTLSES
jgi:hypothetical protein